jgi:hypothetical protein
MNAIDSKADPFAISTPEQFFDYVLLPNFREFEENAGDLRRAMNVAISCLSMRDWMLHSFRMSAPERVGHASDANAYDRYLGAKEPQYATIRTVANASKHLELTRSEPKGFSAGDVQVEFLRCGDPCGIPLRPIKVRTADGSMKPINWMLGCVVAMWGREIGREPWRV